MKKNKKEREKKNFVFVLSGCHASTWRDLHRLNLFASGLNSGDCTTKKVKNREYKLKEKGSSVLCGDCLNSSVPRFVPSCYSSIFYFYSLSLFQAETAPT